MRISRTGGDVRASGERRECPLDLRNDTERHGKRFASILATHRDWSIAPHRRQKTLELQSQRLTLGRDQRHAFDERFDGLRALRQLGEVDITSQAKELAFTSDWYFTSDDFADLKPIALADWVDFSAVDAALKDLGAAPGMDEPTR